MVYRLWLVPARESERVKKQEQVVEATTGSSTYQHRLQLGLDGFSGYAIFRSETMDKQLRSRGVKLDLVDDGADYNARLKHLADGQLQMAVFPIDALLKASEQLQALPATIIAIVDETRGADALLAFKAKYPSIDSLNSTDTRFVLVGDSPSETLVRVLMHKFQLNAVTSNSYDLVASEKEVLARYRAAKPVGNEVFVTWEPVVSEMIKNAGMHVLADTAQETGFIVDALVVSRDYLVDNEAVVLQVLECYFRTLYEYRGDSVLVELLLKDAANAGAKLDQSQAERLADGIRWKNTQENFAHFGLRAADLGLVEDMIDRIKRVLLETGALKSDPTEGNSRKLFFEQPLRELQNSNFHPGLATETIREEYRVTALSDEAWEKLVTVGTAQVPPLIYARGTSTLTQSSMTKLDDLVENLKSWPMYYLMVQGNASDRGGNVEANRQLAKQRAESALQYLLSKGVPREKVRVTSGEVTGQLSVTFVLGQPAY